MIRLMVYMTWFLRKNARGRDMLLFPFHPPCITQEFT